MDVVDDHIVTVVVVAVVRRPAKPAPGIAHQTLIAISKGHLYQ